MLMTLSLRFCHSYQMHCLPICGEILEFIYPVGLEGISQLWLIKDHGGWLSLLEKYTQCLKKYYSLINIRKEAFRLILIFFLF